MIRYLSPSGRGLREFPVPPRNSREFFERFPTEEACRDHLFRLCFPEGFRCWRCGHTSFNWHGSKHLLCARVFCRRKHSLTAGTILQATRKPLKDWFWAAFLVAQRGACASELKRAIKLTYKIAWLWCHKLRRVMSLKTTLDQPFPPFPENRVRNRATEGAHFGRNGAFRWFFDRPDGLGSCCERLMKPDWDAPDREADPERHRLYYTGRAPLAYERLFRDYSGSLSDRHLAAYFDESEFRMNHAGMPGDVAAVVLIDRFVETEPCTYRQITGSPAKRPALRIWSRASPRRPYAWEAPTATGWVER